MVINGIPRIGAFICRWSSKNAEATSEDYLALTGTGLWILLFLTKIFTVCYHCQVVREKGERCGHYLHHYLMDNQYAKERKEVGGV